MSFICPHCGFRDFACWHSSHWFLHTMTCKLEDLEVWQPEIAKKLKENKEIEPGDGYWYKVSKFGRCYRVPVDMKSEFKRGHTQDKPKSAKPLAKELLCYSSEKKEAIP